LGVAYRLTLVSVCEGAFLTCPMGGLIGDKMTKYFKDIWGFLIPNENGDMEINGVVGYHSTIPEKECSWHHGLKGRVASHHNNSYGVFHRLHNGNPGDVRAYSELSTDEHLQVYVRATRECLSGILYNKRFLDFYTEAYPYSF